MMILRDKGGREELRKQGIKITQDATTRQNNALREIRAEGKIGYIARGRVYVKEGYRPQGNASQYSQTSTQHTPYTPAIGQPFNYRQTFSRYYQERGRVGEGNEHGDGDRSKGPRVCMGRREGRGRNDECGQGRVCPEKDE